MNRRDFFAVLGGGVVVMLVEDDVYAQETGGGRGGPREQPQNLYAWLHIGETGVVTVYSCLLYTSPAPSSPISCWPMRSTAPLPRPNPRCSKP